MNVTEAIRSRRAVRLFSAEPVPEELIAQIIEAGGRSQSSKNTQPWQFILIQNRTTLEKLAKTGDFAGHLAGANFAVALVGEATHQWNSFDLGQAAAQMQLCAWELGVGSCIAAIYQVDEARSLLGVPANTNFFCVISFGYPAAEHKPLKLGGRKPLDTIVRRERWD
jgi:nitroreductase